MTVRADIFRGAVVAATGIALLLAASGCSDRDLAEVHVKLFLRIEHLPPQRAEAGKDVELQAVTRSSLEGSKLEAWVRIVDTGEGATKIPLVIDAEGVGRATIPGRARGQAVHYVIEARDAAGLVVALPRGSADGATYTLRFEGKSSRILGAISFLSALLAALLFVGAGAAAVQTLRGRMSAGPAGMLGGFGVALVLLGLLALGGIHAYQVAGRPWPSSPVFLALSRGELALASLIWIGNLFLGRRVLLDEDPEGAPRGERGFALTAVLLGVAVVLATLF